MTSPNTWQFNNEQAAGWKYVTLHRRPLTYQRESVLLVVNVAHPDHELAADLAPALGRALHAAHPHRAPVVLERALLREKVAARGEGAAAAAAVLARELNVFRFHVRQNERVTAVPGFQNRLPRHDHRLWT